MANRYLTPGLLLALFLMVLTPVLVVEMPPLLDYPNHLARLWLLEGGAKIPPLDAMYRPSWGGSLTNIGIDLIACALRSVIPAFQLGRILIGAAVILPPLGAVALNYRAFGGFSPWQLIFPALGWSLTLLAGFLNFQIGLGLALLAVAADGWISARGPWISTAARAALGLALIVIHPFALAFYAVLLAGMAFGRDTVDGAPLRDLLPRFLRGARAAAVCAAPPLLLLIVGCVLPREVSPPYLPAIRFNGLTGALKALASPFASYNAEADLAIALLLVSVPVLGALLRRVSVHWGLLIAAFGLGLLALCMPSDTPQAGWMDRRLPLMALLTLVSALKVGFGSTRASAAALGAAAIALVALRTGWVGWNWLLAEPMTASTRAALSVVPPGSAILPVQIAPSQTELQTLSGRFLDGDEDTYRHLPTLAIPWRHAFVPTLFAATVAQPIRTLPPWKEIAYPYGGGLAHIQGLTDPLALPLGSEYVLRWRERFDYVLVLNADAPWPAGYPLPPGLRLVADRGFARVYAIDRPTGEAGK